VAYADIAPIPKRMTIVVGLCVVGLMAFGLALSYYKNILFDRQLATMQERNAKLRDDVMQGYMELAYYRSSQYKDKYAKENFGLLREGEKVLYYSKPQEQAPLVLTRETTLEEKEAIYEENLRNIAVIDHWRIYLFHRDKLEALRAPVL
jgi:cell division protein FtsB